MDILSINRCGLETRANGVTVFSVPNFVDFIESRADTGVTPLRTGGAGLRNAELYRLNREQDGVAHHLDTGV